MSDIGGAIGTAAEGSLFAAAVSRRAARRGEQPGHFHESDCLNCDTPLVGAHCHACGQAAHLHRTLGALGHDLAHGVLHLDGKTWRTLPMLAWKPGELTRRYIHGERARFVSPMALFLFSIFLMFAVFQALGITAPTDITTSESLRSALVEQKAKTESALAKARAEAAKPATTADARTKTQKRISELEDELDAINSAEKIKVGSTIDVDNNSFRTGIRFIDEGIVHKWQKNPGLMMYKLQSNSYKYSWLLIPLSLPFMWLLFFWKRGVRAYDHAIFVTYSIAFMSLLFVVVSLLAKWGASDALVVPLVTILPAWHIYRQLRGAYGLSRFSALWRLCALTVLIMIVIVLFLQVLLVLGAF